MPSPDDPTDENAPFPWRRGTPPALRPALHLVVAWFHGEPERIGQIARIDAPCWLGRGDAEPEDISPVRFFEVRPGSAVPSCPLETRTISRRQLLFEPQSDKAVRVQCVGRRRLFHNGVPAEECAARAGDTLMLENTAVFAVEERPPALFPLRYYPEPHFDFGMADPYGLVGETPPAWRLREELAAAAGAEDHVLLLGESGSGKELAATLVHRLSPAASGPFVARNAATFPTGLVEAELFGTARNYPNTGSPERGGLIAAANGGTLLLDEIGELPEGTAGAVASRARRRGRLSAPRRHRGAPQPVSSRRRDQPRPGAAEA